MKKLLITLSLICGVVLLSFCSANGDLISTNKFTVISTSSFTGVGYVPGSGNLCIVKPSSSSMSYNTGNGNVNMDRRTLYCFTGGNITVRNSNSYDLAYGYFDLSSNCPTCPTCEEKYTSLECQTEYNLIPISSVDHEYCESNDLCTLCDTPINTGDIQRSALFINTIQYPGGPIINLDLGDNLDYTYSTGNASVDISVGGYEIDEEYLNGVIDSQTYTPTKEDFTKVFSLFGSYGGLLVVCLFVILVFYFVKKLFK